MTQNTTELKTQAETLAKSNGADLFGVADLTPAAQFMKDQGGEQMENFPRAVSVGIRLSDHIVDGHSVDEKHSASLYWHHVYTVVTPELETLSLKLQGLLQEHGFSAFPIPGSMPYDQKNLKGLFSHKLAAHLSGMGWIGKSCLLINPDFGPRVRFGTVLTNAPLPADSPIERQCGKCTACIDSCPVDAFTGIEFDPAESVQARFDTVSCEAYRREHPCGLCVSKCPIGIPKK